MGAALDMPVKNTIQIRRDTAANWASINPILASGEQGYETDTQSLKIGDGTTRWNSLGYQFYPAINDYDAVNTLGAYFDGTGFKTTPTGTLNYLFTPDSSALDISGDIDLSAKLTATDWVTPTGTGERIIVSKFGQNATWVRNYYFSLQGTGNLRVYWSGDGTTQSIVQSTAIVPFNSGDTGWVRLTIDVNNGAGNSEFKFWTSTDGTNWTQLGNTVTAAVFTFVNSASPLFIGAFNGNNTTNDIRVILITGFYKRIIVKNGIDGTVAFDANLEAVPIDSFTFTESSANAATVFLVSTRYNWGLPGAHLSNITTAALSANTTYYSPFTVRNKPITVKHLAFEVATAPASTATARVAIYKADKNMQPTGAPIMATETFTVSTTATNYRRRTPLTKLPTGNYLIAFNTNVAFTPRIFLGAALFIPNTIGVNANVWHSVSQTLTGDYPSTPVAWNTRTAANTAARNIVLLGWD